MAHLNGWKVVGGEVQKPIRSEDLEYDYVERCVDNPEDLHDLLALVMVRPPTVKTLFETFTEAEREEATRWAALEHLGAADNLVERLPKPERVKQWERSMGDA